MKLHIEYYFLTLPYSLEVMLVYANSDIKNENECNQCKCCDTKNCDCAGFCPLYKEVLEWTGGQCFTVSPDMRLYESVIKLNADWQLMFEKLTRHTTNLLVVLELAGIRPHYHCIAEIKDRVGFNATLFSWSRYANVRKHNMFKAGLHYLFKDAYKTYLDTGIQPVVEQADYKTKIEIRQALKKQLREEAKKAIRQVEQETIPKWMLA